MKAQITSTDKIVTINTVGFDGQTRARVWEGVTENGVQFIAYIPRVSIGDNADSSQFDRDFKQLQIDWPSESGVEA